MPIFFIARGHSGTRLVAKALEESGVFIGDTEDRRKVNNTYDSLDWTFGFQRALKTFELRNGSIPIGMVNLVGSEVMSEHLSKGYHGGAWGAKTCEGVFSHHLYRELYPQAKFIYLERDGKDSILSGNGYLGLASKNDGNMVHRLYWDYFKHMTFSNVDWLKLPFEVPGSVNDYDKIRDWRFTIQAISWVNHHRSYRLLKSRGELSSNIFEMSYETLIKEPNKEFKKLLAFILPGNNIELNKISSLKKVYSTSIGKWRDYGKHISDFKDEDIQLSFKIIDDYIKKEAL